MLELAPFPSIVRLNSVKDVVSDVPSIYTAALPERAELIVHGPMTNGSVVVPEPPVTQLHAAKSESLAMTIGACEPFAPITSGPGKTIPATSSSAPEILIGFIFFSFGRMPPIGAHREGMGRAGLFAALATPFTILIFPSTETQRSAHIQNPLYTADWTFVFLLLALTPASVLLSLWLTRRS